MTRGGRRRRAFVSSPLRIIFSANFCLLDFIEQHAHLPASQEKEVQAVQPAFHRSPLLFSASFVLPAATSHSSKFPISIRAD